MKDSRNQTRKSIITCVILLCIVSVIVFAFLFYKKHFRPTAVTLENEELVAASIRDAMIRRSYRVRISFSSNASDPDMYPLLEELLLKVYADDSDPRGGDYLRFQCGGCKVSTTTRDHYLTKEYEIGILPDYYTNVTQEEYVDRKVAEIIASFNLTEDASDYEKVCLVNRYICDNVEYDTVHKHTPGSKHIQSTAYGALAYRTALCQGYAVLTYRLLRELGVDNRIVTGEVCLTDTPERHAWNIVAIDGVYYHLDVTLNDVNGDLSCFLKSADGMEIEHLPDEEYRTDEFVVRYPVAQEDYLN